MVKKWVKKLDKLDKNLSKSLYIIINDLINLKFDGYKIDKVEGFDNLFKTRKGKIRIIFSNKNDKVEIEKVDFRGDVYKGL